MKICAEAWAGLREPTREGNTSWLMCPNSQGEVPQAQTELEPWKQVCLTETVFAAQCTHCQHCRDTAGSEENKYPTAHSPALWSPVGASRWPNPARSQEAGSPQRSAPGTHSRVGSIENASGRTKGEYVNIDKEKIMNFNFINLCYGFNFVPQKDMLKSCPPEPQKVTLFDIGSLQLQLVKMRSYWTWVVP